MDGGSKGKREFYKGDRWGDGKLKFRCCMVEGLMLWIVDVMGCDDCGGSLMSDKEGLLAGESVNSDEGR